MPEIDTDVALEHFAKNALSWLRSEDAATGDPPIPSHRALTQLVAYGLGSDVAVQVHFLDRVVTHPLQKIVGYALLGMGYYSGDEVILTTEEREFHFLELRPQVFTVKPNAKSNDAWADFALSLRMVSGYDDEGNPSGPVSQLFVLCDLEDSYEKDRAQLKREQQAEKRLRASGVDVVRFSKSEIWADPMRCADKAYGLMLADVRRRSLTETS